MKKQFLNLGKQPIANGFLQEKDIPNEYLFDLTAEVDTETWLVSLGQFVPGEMMFNDTYAYRASMSNTMQKFFKREADAFRKGEGDVPMKTLEIGSNDGVFIKHFDPKHTIAVEPCGNFAEETNKMGYKTYPDFWDDELALTILDKHGKQDLVFAANCMCHIPAIQNAFENVAKVLSDDGVFVFTDPSLASMINRGSYDQLYDEHAHIFSVTALGNILDKAGMRIIDVEHFSGIHGGSNQISAVKKTCLTPESEAVQRAYDYEEAIGLSNLDTYMNYAKRVQKSKDDLITLLMSLKQRGKKIIGYGASSKSTTVLNYCGVDSSVIEYFIDTTPEKQGKLTPGTHIPILTPEEGLTDDVDFAFLGAWNFASEISSKEKALAGRFITHVPMVHLT